MYAKQNIFWFLIISILLFIIAGFSIGYGEVNIPFLDTLEVLKGNRVSETAWSYIVENRLNRTVMAVIGGGALSITGLILQVFFRNPLAGPGVLGISTGVILGVAIVVLGGFSLTLFGVNVSLIISGLLGAFLILIILMYLSRYIKQSITLLIVGLMLSYFTSAFVSTLYHWANLEQSRQFIIWSLGSFEGVNTNTIIWLVPIVLIFILLLAVIVKSLNALVLGEEYAKTMGVNIKQTKTIIIIVSSVLTAIVTVYCGPVAFIGIAVPQIVRGVIKSNDYKFSLPMAFLMGGLFAILADVFIRFSGNLLPLNTVTSLLGAPIIIWTIISLNKQQH